jgi:2-keto-4-pentenoate hydratase/2-oxohepta-3-ene-1,7-dioic acid hydratase in catechol pathway
MRLITYTHDGRTRLGSWIENDSTVVDLRRAAEMANHPNATSFDSMLALIESGETAWEFARHLTSQRHADALLKTSAVRLLAPLPVPAQVRDFLCFEEHLVNATKAIGRMIAQRSEDPEKVLREIGQWKIPEIWYKQPIYYTANRFAIAAPDEDVVRPAYSKLFDYELEFAAIIGKAGKDISRSSAREHIFGYTIYNDWSARDEQALVMDGKLGPGKGKDFDQGISLGPCIVTADELTDPYSLTMKARVNGEQWSSGSSGGMYHRFEDCIADVTRSQTIYPGEVIGSGTVGTGCGMEQLRFLNDNDVVELEVSGIGTLRNRVVAG